jgi:hypothetical protein
MPRHLLHSGQVDTQIEQVPDPGPAEIVGRGGLDLSLEPALAADPPGAARAEASQLTPVPKQAPRLEHGAEERARLRPPNPQPVLNSRKGRGRQRELPWLATLATTHAQLTADQVEIGEVNGDGLGSTQAATVGQGQEGSVTTAAGGGVLRLTLVRRTAAALEEAAQLAGREVAAARF